MAPLDDEDMRDLIFEAVDVIVWREVRRAQDAAIEMERLYTLPATLRARRMSEAKRRWCAARGALELARAELAPWITPQLGEA